MTAAGVILIVLGAVQCLAGVVFLVLSPADLAQIGSIGNMDLESVARGIGLFSLVIGALEIFAGILVLRLSEGGRIFAHRRGGPRRVRRAREHIQRERAGVLTLGLYAFVIYVLFSQREAFRRTRPG